MDKQVALFQHKQIRRIWYKNQWWFSTIDVVEVLIETKRPRKYWSDLKTKLIKEGYSEVSEKIGQLKLISYDGKERETDCANTETMLRIIQSIPSPKAEPFKRWLAKIGKERVDEINDPELAMERMKLLYQKKGYPKSWIDKRIRGIAVRQDLTQEWQERGASKSVEFAILTNEIMQGAFDMKVEDYKNLKGLDKENLRDHMNDLELILTMLAEATTTKIHQDRNSQGFPKLKKDAKDGGSVAGRTRKDIEKTSGKKVITDKNYLPNKKKLIK